MGNGAGICTWKGCDKPRHQHASGNYNGYCREHMNEQSRNAKAKKNAAKKTPVLFPISLRVIARRCEKCGVKYPSVRPYFDTSKDNAAALYRVCGYCEGTLSLAALPPLGAPLYAWQGAQL